MFKCVIADSNESPQKSNSILGRVMTPENEQIDGDMPGVATSRLSEASRKEFDKIVMDIIDSQYEEESPTNE